MLKKSSSLFKIYRNNKLIKTRMDKFNINKSDCGPMVLDALIHIKNYEDIYNYCNS